jgi:hypothetical protein
MRELIIERLIENNINHARRVWHWGKDKLRIHELALRVEYNRLTNEELLEKYESFIAELYI